MTERKTLKLKTKSVELSDEVKPSSSKNLKPVKEKKDKKESKNIESKPLFVEKNKLNISAIQGDYESFKKALKEGEEISISDKKNSLLHLACGGGNVEIIGEVLKIGEDYPEIFEVNSALSTAIHHAIFKDRDEAALFLLKESKIDVNICDIADRTALHVLLARSEDDINLELVQALLEAGSNLEIEDRRGNSCLNIVKEHGFEKIQKIIDQFQEKSKNNEDLSCENDEATQDKKNLESENNKLSQIKTQISENFENEAKNLIEKMIPQFKKEIFSLVEDKKREKRENIYQFEIEKIAQSEFDIKELKKEIFKAFDANIFNRKAISFVEYKVLGCESNYQTVFNKIRNLFEIVENGDEKELNKLLSRNLYLSGLMKNFVGYENEFLHHIAIKNNHIECLKILVDCGVNIYDRDLDNNSSFELAFEVCEKYGDDEICNYLENYSDKEIFSAIENNRKDRFERIIEGGANILVKSKYDRSFIEILADSEMGERENMKEILCVRLNQGLFEALKGRNLDLSLSYLENGADLSFYFDYLVKDCDKEFVKSLIEKSGYSYFDNILSAEEESVKEKILDLKIDLLDSEISRLIENDEIIDEKNGYYLIHKIVIEKKHNLLAMMVENGVDVNLQDNYGVSALIYAALAEDEKAVKILLDAQARLDLECENRSLMDLILDWRDYRYAILRSLISCGVEFEDLEELRVSEYNLSEKKMILEVLKKEFGFLEDSDDESEVMEVKRNLVDFSVDVESFFSSELLDSNR